MNAKQIVYDLKWAYDKTNSWIFSSVSAYLGFLAVGTLNTAKGSSLNTEQLKNEAILEGILAALYGCFALKHIFYHTTNLIAKWTSSDKDNYPIEFAETVVVADKEGLDALLAKTGENNVSEWGTALKVRMDGEQAIIESILPFDSAKQDGLLQSSYDYRLDDIKADNNGYNGMHHYYSHFFSIPASMSFAVSPKDRQTPLNWMNLITFNSAKGPEVIAYNRRFTYIPADSSKRLLVRATHSEIRDYLGK